MNLQLNWIALTLFRSSEGGGKSVLGGTLRPGHTFSMVLVIMFHTFLFQLWTDCWASALLVFLEHLFHFLSVRNSGSLAQSFYGKNLVDQLNYVGTQFCSSTFITTSVIAHVNSFYFLKKYFVTVFWPPHSKMSRETRFSCGISLSSTTSDSHSPLQPHIQPHKIIQKRWWNPNASKTTDNSDRFWEWGLVLGHQPSMGRCLFNSTEEFCLVIVCCFVL